MTVHPWNEKRPSRVRVLGVYSKRVLLRNFNSKPFLSGDLFADNSDYVHNPTRFRYNRSWYKELKNAGVIFCPSSDLQDFLTEFKDSINAKVILTGNSDYDFIDVPTDIPKSVRHLFLQNSFISDGQLISTLPIGIENIRYGVNGLPSLMNLIENPVQLNKILMGPFGLTHGERITAFNTFKTKNEIVDLITDRLSPYDFARVMQKYRYVAAVRGNGVDTHRLWEALYRGSTPILKRDSWSQSLTYLGFPVQLVTEWEELELKNSLLSPHTPFNSRQHPSLWWPYWRKLINDFL